MAMPGALMSLAIMAVLLIRLAMAANYTVGGPTGGWDTSSDLQTWATSKTFAVGDNLIFQYPINHDVLEVSQADYASCQSGSPIQAYNGGTTVIPLSSPGKRYFICGTAGHCNQGMKVEIDTLASSSPPPSASSPAPESSSALPPAVSPESSAPSPAPTMSPPSPLTSSLGSPASPPEASLPSPTASLLPAPAPSLAYKGSAQTSLIVGLSLIKMMVLYF